MRKNISLRNWNNWTHWELKDIDVPRIYEGAIGLPNEVGELLDIVKKDLFHKKGYDRNEIVSEAGDVMWYLATILNHYNISFDEVIEENVRKINSRMKNKKILIQGPIGVGKSSVIDQLEKMGYPVHKDLVLPMIESGITDEGVIGQTLFERECDHYGFMDCSVVQNYMFDQIINHWETKTIGEIVEGAKELMNKDSLYIWLSNDLLSLTRNIIKRNRDFEVNNVSWYKDFNVKFMTIQNQLPGIHLECNNAEEVADQIARGVSVYEN